jgi:hypothetical protein
MVGNMIRLAIVYKNGEIKAHNFKTQDEVETFLLAESEKGITRAESINQKTKERKTLWNE